MNTNELEVEEIDEIVETNDEDGNDLTDWKALALKNQGIAKRNKTKFEKAKELLKVNAEKKPELPEKKEKKEFDYGELAYIEAKGFSNEEDVAYIEKTTKESGKSLKELLSTNWFKADLKERQEIRASKNAIPEGTKRSGGGAKDQVEYWIAKGELPPADQKELRRKVINAKIDTGKARNKFAPNSIV